MTELLVYNAEASEKFYFHFIISFKKRIKKVHVDAL